MVVWTVILPPTAIAVVTLLVLSLGVAQAGQSGQVTHDSVLIGMHFVSDGNHDNLGSAFEGKDPLNVTPGLSDYLKYMPRDLAHMSYADFWRWWYELERCSLQEADGLGGGASASMRTGGVSGPRRTRFQGQTSFTATIARTADEPISEPDGPLIRPIATIRAGMSSGSGLRLPLRRPRLFGSPQWSPADPALASAPPADRVAALDSKGRPGRPSNEDNA